MKSKLRSEPLCRPNVLLLPFLLLANASLWAASPSDFLPPAPGWHGASEDLIVEPDNPFITPAERMGLLDTPDYAETVAFLEKLVAASPRLKLHEFGRSAQGRKMYAVIASVEGASCPATLATNDRPTLLAQAGIHAGEIDGKDAGLMLLRDIATANKAHLLERANFLFVPVFNVDGHERISEWNRPNQRGPKHQGWRTTAQNLNLNRDYLKADSPEMCAMLKLINDSNPALYVDLHVTDGIDYAYDITYGYNGLDGAFAWSPRIAAWLENALRPVLDGALKAHGHIPGGLVFSVNDRDLSQGIVRRQGSPNFSHGYGDLRHLPTILVENHSLKPYPQRVLGTYVLLETTLRVVGAQAMELKSAIASDSGARADNIPVNWNVSGVGRKTDFLGIDYTEYFLPASGIKELRWLGKPKVYRDLPITTDQPGLVLKRAKAYYVPVTKPEVIAGLKLHGIRMEMLTESRQIGVQMYRIADVNTANAPFETRFRLRVGVKPEHRVEWFPSGSVRVSTDQPLGDLATVMLEPACSDSLFAWGFFNEILQRTEYIEGYAAAPMAEQMLAEDPLLKAEFQAKLSADPKFAEAPEARLRWFYERSRFYDERYLLYPIGIER